MNRRGFLHALGAAGSAAALAPVANAAIPEHNWEKYDFGDAHIEGYASVVDDDGRFGEVQENVSWTMKFASGVVVSCNTTYGAEMPGFFRVHGSKGMIHMAPAFAYQGLHLKAEIKRRASD